MSSAPVLLFDEDPCGHDLYRACRDHDGKQPVRTALERAWNLHWQLCPEKPEQFVRQFRLDFHARAWELFLLSVLTDAGMRLEPAQAKGPDICLRLSSGTRCWIEAVAPTPGTNENAVFQRPPGNWAGALPKDNNLILRYRSVLEQKLTKLNAYKSSNIVTPDDAYVIAVYQGGILDSDLYDMELPALVRAVLPIGETVLNAPIYSDAEPTLETLVREHVAKANKQPVSTTFFLEPRTEFVSGVLFARHDIWNISWSAEKSLHFMHRPSAKVVVPRGAFPSRCELWMEPGGAVKHRGRCAQHGYYANDPSGPAEAG